ncbi:MAG: hypothetical protein HWE14_08430 [Flavobacteriia bacterium]|nr:hypothetical protein [Flavobacteriia bacterium]
MRVVYRYIILLLAVVSISSCKQNDPDDFNSRLKGSGVFVFDDYEPFADVPMNIYYHVPTSVDAKTPICIAFHGNGRDALETRDALISKADKLGFIAIVPEFSRAQFPGADRYMLGNMFVDGDNPSPSTQKPEEDWTFSIIEPLFDHISELTSNENTGYDVIGHSAGAQFAHRFLMFKPGNRVNRMVCSAAGWYTMPDDDVQFPYGRGDSPTDGASLVHFFDFPMYVIVGTLDNDPNDPSLRRNASADAQGTNRLARAQYFYTESQNTAQSLQIPFGWQYKSLLNVDHDRDASMQAGADLLYK